MPLEFCQDQENEFCRYRESNVHCRHGETMYVVFPKGDTLPGRAPWFPAQFTPIKALLAECSVSVIIDDEADSIAELCSELLTVLRQLSLDFEVTAVNDGSTYQSLERLREQSERHPEIRIVNFRRNYGQTAALMAAIDHSRGDVLIAIDADLQNDPKDIPLLLAQLDQGYDVVSGRRPTAKMRHFRAISSAVSPTSSSL
jgi:cellulose synthase/poly-beta-1,6-N-acetylglucosamine synthase-like glycosyltransferase